MNAYILHQNQFAMYLNQNEITILCNGQDEKSRKTLVYASTLGKRINKQDLCEVRVSDTLFEVMMETLHAEGKSVFNKAHPFYQENIKGKELSNSDYLEYLKRMPDLLKGPVAMYHNRVVVCNTPTDILKVLNKG